MVFQNLFKPNIRKLEARIDIEGLIRAASHKDHIVRFQAVSALSALPGKRPNDADSMVKITHALFERYSKESDSFVRRAAAFALAKLGDDRGWDDIVTALDSSDEIDRYNAIRALEQLRNPRAIEPLLSFLKRKSYGDDAYCATRVLISAGWKTEGEIEKELRHARAVSEPRRCLHLERNSINQLCRDCGAPLVECKKCGAWFHEQESRTCNTY